MTRATDLPVTIRMAYADDYGALSRLASLDSAERVPPRPLLLAEVGAELRAAVSLADGSAIADPFHPTSELLELLRMRAAGRMPAPARRWRPRPRARSRRLLAGPARG